MTGSTNCAAQRTDDDGFTLIEFIVAMGIFSILLGIFSVSIASFSRTTVRTIRTSSQSTQARVAFDLFDKQVRAASAINVPTLVGANWYVEYQNDSLLVSSCTQWVLRTDTHVLAYRTWVPGNTTTTPTAWRPVALNVVNTASQQPFALSVSTTAVPLQRLTVTLNYRQGTGPATTSSSLFAARNTSTSTKTNTTGNTVCSFSGWRP